MKKNMATKSASSDSGTGSLSLSRHAALIVIVLTNVLLSFGFQIWRSLFNNFAVGELGVRADQMGVIQAIREVPGLLGFGVGLLALVMTEMRIAGLSVVLMGVGIALTGTVHSIVPLIASTLLMSVGFHFFMPGNSSALLMLVDHDEAPGWLGRLSSWSAVGAVLSALVVYAALDRLGFRMLFYWTGGAVALVGLILLPWARQPARPPHTKERTPIRRQYWLYYLLEFLMGSRRHIFTTFAIFLLVEEHHVSAQVIATLFLINNVCGALFFRQFGRIIARFGERQMLTFNFLCLILVFLGYAFVPVLALLYVLFVADHILFGFRIGIQSYFQKIALHPREITPNLSLGQTINHVAAVVIPVVGGVVWEVLGSQYTFLIGVGIVVLSLIVVQWMRVERPTELTGIASAEVG
ncbi:MAG TPA: MFS transporter [Chloroflexi bacterium]|nr:MFS transporter [Chloroflexota bacterium]